MLTNDVNDSIIKIRGKKGSDYMIEIKPAHKLHPEFCNACSSRDLDDPLNIDLRISLNNNSSAVITLCRACRKDLAFKLIDSLVGRGGIKNGERTSTSTHIR